MVAGSGDLPYSERLATFRGYWDAHEAAARQLAAIGHVYDRPPLEAIEEGSRCVSCSDFVRRELSITALEGSIGGHIIDNRNYGADFEGFHFHHGSCHRLQVRMPFEPQAAPLGELYGGSIRISDLRERWKHRSTSVTARESVRTSRRTARTQTGFIFNLPTELRLQIYCHVLPDPGNVVDVVPLNRRSARITTRAEIEKIGPRDLTKANILRTCKAIHNEALDILYISRTYKFASSRTLYLFLRQIGKHGRDLLKAVDLYCGSREDAITFSLLATCPKLRAMTIRLPRPRIMFPRAPLWCLDGMAALLSLRGLENVTFADSGPDMKDMKTFLQDGSHDAAIIKREVMRLRGEESGVRWVDGYLDA